jgi:hypothetical protein
VWLLVSYNDPGSNAKAGYIIGIAFSGVFTLMAFGNSIDQLSTGIAGLFSALKVRATITRDSVRDLIDQFSKLRSGE